MGMEKGGGRGGVLVSAVLVLVLCSVSPIVGGDQGVFGYDGRSLVVNGTRRLLFSGSIHYPRSTPQMWPSLISQAKKGGIDVIQTYVFWNVHEPIQGQYNFEGRNDLVAFMKEIQAKGLYASLRIGPFIESEWKYGGFPFWLHDIPGIVFRSDNEPFKKYMQQFTSMIVNMMKKECLYASQGGPIILSQIENEYQNVEPAFHERGPPYVRWAAAMAVGLDTGVPWMMCKQNDAPDPVINTCNGMKCGETFVGPNSPDKPAMWTENWTSFYEVFGGGTYLRSAEDIAYHVALFIAAKKGSFINYYMYHGGTNFGRSASSYVRTSYYDQAPLDEYGLIRQPKWGHLRELHAAIKLCSDTLLHGTYSNSSLGNLQEAHVFQQPGKCVAFITNRDKKQSADVQFQEGRYALPTMSISILPDCKNEVFNTGKVTSQYGSRSTSIAQSLSNPQEWESFPDRIFNNPDASFFANELLEQMNMTKDDTDYLWYSASYEHLPSNDQLELHVYSRAHVVHAFANNIYLGNSHGSHDNGSTNFAKAIPLQAGKNNISILSVMVGSPDSGAFLESRVTGLRSVKIKDSGSGNILQDISNSEWGYQVSLSGEKLKIYTEEGSNEVGWEAVGESTHHPLMWYKATFNTPPGNDPIVLNLGSMGKGEAWINGESIGRFWVSFTAPNGQPSQSLYHVPLSFLKPSGNLLVLFEEIGGDPLKISLETVSVTNICGIQSESHPSSLFKRQRYPGVHLQCPGGRSISAIKFASFGTPAGDCDKYVTGSCHSAASKAVAEKACIGKRRCSIFVSANQFGEDPCPRIAKSLLVSATCH